jgi:hypothetical protein
MIEVESKIIDQPIAILIDPKESHSYIALDLVERFHFKKSMHEKSWLVQLDNGTKRKIDEIVKGFPLDMDRVNIVVDLNIISLDSYDVLIGMHWLDVHHIVLDCHNKTFTCLHEEGK